MSDESRTFAKTWAAATGAARLEAPHAFFDAAQVDAKTYGVSARRFADFIAGRLKSEDELSVAAPHAQELLLVCACLDGNVHAQRTLDEAYLIPLRGALGSDAMSHDDVLQVVREKLLMGSAPKLGTYSGRGDLRRFLKAVAVRALVDRGRGNKETRAEDAFFESLSAGGTPEVEHLRSRYKAEFAAAFAEAMARLPERERLWLRQYHLDGIKLERLAAMHGVVPSTISRALQKTRNDLLERTRDELVKRGLERRDVDSVLYLLGSRMSLPGDVTG